MTLDDFLSHADENMKVRIINSCTDEVLAIYDGRNSIPASYNILAVRSFGITKDGWLYVEVE